MLWLGGLCGGVRYELFLDKVDSGNRACVICSGANRYEPAIYEHYLPAAPGKYQSATFAPRCAASEFGQRAIPARRDEIEGKASS